MIHHDSDLFYNICNAINEHNLRQNHYLSLMFQSNLMPKNSDSKRSLIISFALS